MFFVFVNPALNAVSDVLWTLYSPFFDFVILYYLCNLTIAVFFLKDVVISSCVFIIISNPLLISLSLSEGWYKLSSWPDPGSFRINLHCESFCPCGSEADSPLLYITTSPHCVHLHIIPISQTIYWPLKSEMEQTWNIHLSYSFLEFRFRKQSYIWRNFFPGWNCIVIC